MSKKRKSKIVDAIDEVNEDDLEIVSERIKDAEKELKSLRAMEKVIRKRLNGSLTGRAEEVTYRESQTILEDIVALLHKEGPQTIYYVAKQLNVTPKAVSVTVGRSKGRVGLNNCKEVCLKK